MPILERETCLFPNELIEDSRFETDFPNRRWRAVLTKAAQREGTGRDSASHRDPFLSAGGPKRNRMQSRVVYSHVPLFPGYVFMFASDEERLQSLKTNRISMVIDVNDQQQLRSDLNQVYQLIQSGAPLTIEERLQPGQPVRVRSGSFEGVEGVIIDRRRGLKCLLVSVRFLQRGVSLEIDDFMVEPI